MMITPEFLKSMGVASIIAGAVLIGTAYIWKVTR